MRQLPVRRTIPVGFALLVLCVLEGGPPLPRPHADASPQSALEPDIHARLDNAYARLPLLFVPADGADESGARFVAHAAGTSVSLSRTGVAFVLGHGQTAGMPSRKRIRDPIVAMEQSVVTMRFSGANHAPAIVGKGPQETRVNYLVGNDPAAWRTNVSTYARVEYRDLYPGIDAAFYGRQTSFEYDFIVRAGSDPSRIRLQLDGARGVSVDGSGDLVVETPAGILRQHRPVAYQKAGGKRARVAADYVLDTHGDVRFRLGAYDRAQTLVIDPTLAYSTYAGGTLDEFVRGYTMDGSGNAYITGFTNSTDFPTSAGAMQPARSGGVTDAFVLKLDAAGTAIVFATYLGGNGSDPGESIALEPSGNIVIVGGTTSTDFPTVGAFQTANAGGLRDVFIAKLNPAGTALVHSSYLGGNNDDIAVRVATDASGNAYTTGYTKSANFRTSSPLQAALAGGQDVFIAKVSPAGGLLYSTYLGGSGSDQGSGLATDASGNVFVAGFTDSTNFPTASPFQASKAGSFDAFITKLNPGGSAIVFSTYLGGSDYEFLYDVTIDSAGSLYLTGETGSANFPTTLNGYQPTIRGGSDIWIAKMDAGASGLIFSTFVGGSFDDYPLGLVVDALGQVYVAGGTTSTNFPTVNPVQSAYGGGAEDAIVLELSATGRSLLFSTYLGGLGDDIAWGLALDPSGNPGVAGYTDSTNFPTANALFASKAGGFDTFMLRLVLDRPTLTLTPSTVNFGAVNSGGTLSPRTPAQDLRLTQSGAGAVGWTASANQPWVTITPTSGTGSATLTVSINNTAGTLPVSGALSATLTVTTTLGGNNPTAAINLTMIPTAATTGPAGSLDTPPTGLTGVAGSIPVTGWAIDDIGATQIRLTRDSVPSAGEPAGQQVFIGNAVFVYGARPDVAALFPTRPYKDQAGWGYLLLTNFLPNGGNGTFRLNAFADDVEGRSTLLGTTTITCTNATATAPFGGIDTPSQGGLVSGTFVHFGWALAGQQTASGRLIPTDGSTIDVLIDSVSIGHPTYNNPRTDIQALFPGYFNTDGAIGYKMIDTTMFSNGVHTIAWIATDNMGAAAGIGSRYFTVSNSVAPALRASGDEAARAAMQGSRATPANATLAVTHGFDDNAPPELAFPAADGVIRVRTEQLQRITIDLDRHDGRRYTYDGYTGTGGRVGPLPIGSHLDPVSGLFAWAPGLAFGGTHRLVFVRQGGGVQERILVDVSVGSPRPEAPRRD